MTWQIRYNSQKNSQLEALSAAINDLGFRKAQHVGTMSQAEKIF